MNAKDIHRQYRRQESTIDLTPYMPAWERLIDQLDALGVRFVAIKRGTKLPTKKRWNETKNTINGIQAKKYLANGHNISIAAGTGNELKAYLADFDRDADRGHECAQLDGGFYTYRSNAPHKGKFIFLSPDTIPTRLKSKSHGIDMLGLNSNDTHWQGVIAGIHDSGAPVLVGGHMLPALPGDTVSALWEEWTGRQLFAPARDESDTDTVYDADLATVADAFEYADPHDMEMDYGSWIGIIAAVHDAFGDDALDLVVDWADGKPGEVEAKWRTFDRAYTGKGATLKSLFYFARRGGWVDPTPVATPAPLPEGAVRLDNGAIALKTTPTPEPKPRPKLPACTPALCVALQQAINSPDGRALLHTFKNREIYVSVLAVLLTHATRLGGWKFDLTTRELGELLGKSHMSASRNLHALDRVQLVTYRHSVALPEVGDASPMSVDLSPIIYELLDVTGVNSAVNVTEFTVPTSCNVYTRYAGDGEFADATMRPNPMTKGLYGRTLRGLSASALNGLDLVARGELAFTRRQLVDELGMTPGSAAGATGVYVELGIATVCKVGRTNEYVFSPAWREQLDALVPKMGSFLALYRLKIRNVSDRIVEVERRIKQLGGDPKRVREEDTQQVRDLHTRRKKMLFARQCLMDEMEAKDRAHRPEAAPTPAPGQWVGSPPPRPMPRTSKRTASTRVSEGDLIERRLALYATARESRVAA